MKYFYYEIVNLIIHLKILILDGLEVQQIQFEPAPPSAKSIQMFVFRIHAAHASLGRIFEYGSDSMDALKDGNSNSFREIFHKILTGRF